MSKDSMKGFSIGGGGTLRTENDLNIKIVLIAILVLTLAVWLIPAIPVNIVGAAIVVIFGFFFATVSSRMVGLVGSSNNPVSGMAIATLLIATLILKMIGQVGAQGMQAAIAIGSIICIVSAIAGDTSQDLKTGFLLGATPKKQQIGEIIGVVASYLVGICMGKVDFSGVKDAAWVGLPIDMDMTVFAMFGGNFDASLLITAIITIMPIALATIVEHIGDVSAISSTVGRNFIKDPGLHRTLLGDGLATIVASLFGAPANTTYGENTGVLNLSKVYDPMVVRLAAVFAIFFSFCPKFAAVIQAMPTATVGGISLILYGMISAVGVRNVVENKVDFAKSRNVIIAALILVLSIGINYSSAGAISFAIGDINISLSGLAVGALTGIILNAILPGKDYNFVEEKPDDTGVNFEVGQTRSMKNE